MMIRLCRIALSLLAVPALGLSASKSPARTEVTGYVFARGAVLQPGQVDARKLTRINYAFADIKGGRMVVGTPADAQNLGYLNGLKSANPRLTVLVSVGGWLGSTNFSDVALTTESRRVFEESVMEFLTQYDLDGLDVDWEHPGLPGAGHPFRAEDKQNFTSLVKELRERFDGRA